MCTVVFQKSEYAFSIARNSSCIVGIYYMLCERIFIRLNMVAMATIVDTQQAGKGSVHLCILGLQTLHKYLINF